MSTTVDTLERRRLAALTALRTAAARLAEHPEDRSASVEVEQHAEAAEHYARVVAAVRGADTGVYRPGAGLSVVGDLIRQSVDTEARARVEAATAEARSTTGNYGGLVVPQYLTATPAISGASSRPLCDLLSVPLPPAGMSLIQSRTDTAPSAAHQATQNTAIATSTNMTATTVDLPVVTVAASGRASWQLVQRSDPEGFDRGFLAELVAQADAAQEIAVLNGSGASGQPTGLLNDTGVGTVTVTSTSANDILDAIARAAATSTTTRGRPADLVVMHPRRWQMLLSRTTDRGVALTVDTDPTTPVAGTVLGMNVVATAAMSTAFGTSTNEDKILVTRTADVLVAEEPLRVYRARDKATAGASELAALIEVARYYSVGHRAPGASVVLSGTGLVTPFV